MLLKRQLMYALAALLIVALWEENAAELLNPADTDTLSNLYENLLQREYAGPVVFPNHQMERKAQRSPSLRLRFGRRSDPDVATIDGVAGGGESSAIGEDSSGLLPAAAKRWWGDVNQKPIRSPSLRLRFGKRRTEPALPMGAMLGLPVWRNAYDEAALLQSMSGAGGGGAALDDSLDEYNEDAFDRVVRKPQRLRWGRSVPVYQANADTMENEEEPRHELLNGDNWRNMLLGLSRYGYGVDEDGVDEFQREVRKPGGPLRLRWGRSTGGQQTTSSSSSAIHSAPLNAHEPVEMNQQQQQAQQKKSLAASAANELQQHKAQAAHEVEEAKPLTKN